MKPTTLAVCIGVIALTGCAGQLVVYDDKQAEIKGVPFRTTEVYVKQGLYSKHLNGGACAKSPFQEVVSIPTGAQYYVTAKTAQFAKTAFHIKFSESGAVSEIGLDSEPAAADTLKATADLVKLVLPTAAGMTALRASDVAASSVIEKACNTGEESITYTKLRDYLGDQKR
jgi:hypothetical protein